MRTYLGVGHKFRGLPKEHCTVEYALSKMLGTKRVLDFRFNEIFQGWNPSLNMKFPYVSYVPYTHSLKATLYNVFRVPAF